VAEDLRRQPADDDFSTLTDLASRRLGGSVVYANDELFADKENLIKPAEPVFTAGKFGPKGKTYDGWETRRRREPGHDDAIVRLGAPGIVRGVVVDTSHFRGNYPPRISVEAAAADGYPSAAQLAGLRWHELVPPSMASGDTRNGYQVIDGRRWTHVRLSIYPDGGVARLRVHGVVVPDPAFLAGTVDLAAIEHGGRVVACSDAFFSAAANLLMPGGPRDMSDGWENARRRDGGHDYVVVRLAAAGLPRLLEIDTTYFVGNAPGSVRVLGTTDGSQPVEAWPVMLPQTPVQPDTRHRFLVQDAAEVTHICLQVFPDGGLARLRLLGELTAAGLAGLRQAYQDCLPD
jgi:allantoicase